MSTNSQNQKSLYGDHHHDGEQQYENNNDDTRSMFSFVGNEVTPIGPAIDPILQETEYFNLAVLTADAHTKSSDTKDNEDDDEDINSEHSFDQSAVSFEQMQRTAGGQQPKEASLQIIAAAVTVFQHNISTKHNKNEIPNLKTIDAKS